MLIQLRYLPGMGLLSWLLPGSEALDVLTSERYVIALHRRA